MADGIIYHMVWPKTLKVYIWCAFGVASNGKSVKCWCGNSKVGVASATPAIRHAPPMLVTEDMLTEEMLTQEMREILVR